MSLITVNCPTQRTETMEHTPAADVAVDEVLVINGRVTAAYESVSAGNAAEFIHRADEVEVDKSGVTIVSGDAAYYHSGNDNFTNVSTDAIKCGMFSQPALSGDAKAVMRLDNSVNL